MTTADVIKGMFDETYPIFNGIIEDLTMDELKKTYEGATVGSILDVYAHTVVAEDWIVNELARGGKQFWATDPSWAERIGATPTNGFFAAADLAAFSDAQLAALKEYAAALQASTTSYLGTVTDDDLAKPLEIYGVQRTVAYAFANYAFFHLLEHAGEMAALKGLTGKKGMPY